MYRHAYWTALWMNGKRPEKVESLLYVKPKIKEMTDEEMFEQVKTINKMLGGE
jgi:hypothetical protein